MMISDSIAAAVLPETEIKSDALKSILCQNIVLSGGGTNARGLNQRLANELQVLYPSHKVECEQYQCVGGSLPYLASTDTFDLTQMPAAAAIRKRWTLASDSPALKPPPPSSTGFTDPKLIKVISSGDVAPEHLSWLGGSIISSLPEFPQWCITRKLFDEFGGSAGADFRDDFQFFMRKRTYG